MSTFSVLVALAAVVGVSAVAPPFGQLSVKGTRLIGANGHTVALHGMSLYWSQWKPQFYNLTTVKALKCQWNSNIVRAAMGADQDQGYTSGHQAAQEALLNAVVQAAIDEGIYVIIDWHITGDNTQYTSQAVDFFSRMAKQWGAHPNVLYEIWNEPSGVSWSTVKTYAEKVIPVIRAADSKNIIIVGTPTWSQDVDTAAADPITGQKNIMYTLHFYAATHSVATYGAKAQTALNKGLPIFVTEYGTVEASGGGSVDSSSTAAWWSFLDKNYISYVNWALDDKDEGSAALKVNTAATAVGNSGVTTASGELVKEHLLKQNNYVSC